MAICSKCGQEISWITLLNGNKHPVEGDLVKYDDLPVGRTIVTEGGNVLTVRENINYPSVKGRESHFQHCYSLGLTKL